MKKIILLLLMVLLGSCTIGGISNSSSSNDDFMSGEILDSLESSKNEDLSTTIDDPTSVFDDSSSSGNDSSETSDSSGNDSTEGGNSSLDVCKVYNNTTNPDGSRNMPIPCNRDSKIKIGNDNASMSSFSFKESLPDGFRAINGNNFTKGEIYNDGTGGLRIDQAKKGLQTPMFVTNEKIEVRINFGRFHGQEKPINPDKNKPVMDVLAFDENGNLLRTHEIDELNDKNELKTLNFYMDGTDVAYLEFRLLQFAYNGTKGYNFSMLGVDLIAWPYPL